MRFGGKVNEKRGGWEGGECDTHCERRRCRRRMRRKRKERRDLGENGAARESSCCRAEGISHSFSKDLNPAAGRLNANVAVSCCTLPLFIAPPFCMAAAAFLFVFFYFAAAAPPCFTRRAAASAKIASSATNIQLSSAVLV